MWSANRFNSRIGYYPHFHPYTHPPNISASSDLAADTLLFSFTNSFQLGQPQQTLGIPIF